MKGLLGSWGQCKHTSKSALSVGLHIAALTRTAGMGLKWPEMLLVMLVSALSALLWNPRMTVRTKQERSGLHVGILE